MSPCRPAHAVHFAVYEAAKKGLGETVAETSFAGAAAAGAAATIVSDACMTPFDVIKQRLQVGKLAACWWSIFIKIVVFNLSKGQWGRHFTIASKSTM